jgi:hypothetical protein
MNLRTEYSDYFLEHKPTSQVKMILFDIVSDFTDRRGLRQEWDNIDDDIQEEILEKWLEIIERHVRS